MRTSGIRHRDLLARQARLLALDGSRPAARFVGEIDVFAERPLVAEGAMLADAAVLLPLVERDDGSHLILTRRTAALRTHSGQVALPGGRLDAVDAGSPVAAALREAHEEIGLSPQQVEPIGRLTPFVTTTGFRVHPVVGLVAGEPSLDANPAEVAEVFSVPLDFLMDPANHRLDHLDWQGARRRFYVMTYGSHRIWGVTAGILRLFYDEVFR